MILTAHQNIRIAGIASSVPSHIDQIIQYKDHFGEDQVRQFIKMMGVKERRVAHEKQTASDLAYDAAKRLLAEKHLEPDEIGALIFVSQTPDYMMPSTACILSMRLGLSQDCIAFDVNLGCSGYVYGLNMLAALMQSSNIMKGLLLVGDSVTKKISPEDKSIYMLFGEAGAATLLTKEESKINLMTGAFRTDGNRFKAIIIPAGMMRNAAMPQERVTWGDGNIRSDYDLYMNGVDVFQFGISDVPEMMNEFMQASKTKAEDYDAFVFHQASMMILKQIAKKIKISMEKIPVSIDRYGNTSVATIPITLCHAFAGTAKKEMNMLLCGFGIGLSWGVAAARIQTSDIMPVAETDDYFKDGEVSHD